MKTFSISIKECGIPESALDVPRLLQKTITKARQEFVMTRDGDSLSFVINHPEGDVDDSAYEKYIDRLEKKLGDLKTFVETNAKNVKW